VPGIISCSRDFQLIETGNRTKKAENGTFSVICLKSELPESSKVCSDLCQRVIL